MKTLYTIAVFGVLFAVLLFAGCLGSSSQVQTPTPVPTTVMPVTTAGMKAPTQTPAPAFPNALDLNQYAIFGNGDQQGKATVYRYEVKPTYDWTAPSWNSPREQLAASQPNDLERGYNRETPQDGNTFLFVYVSVQNTGSSRIFTPAPKQFVVLSEGKAYAYSPVHSSDVVIAKISDPQYANQNGQRDPIEYVLPGDNNKVEGFLIYEVPKSFSPATTYVAGNLDYQNSAVWKLG